MEEPSVMIIEWDEIPKQHWEAILNTIRVGSYVRSLPYGALLNAPRLTIPTENGRIGFRKDSHSPLYMEFMKCKCKDGTFVWRRER